MISLFSLLTVASYLGLLVCSPVLAIERKMCVLACLEFIVWFPKETSIMQFVCVHVRVSKDFRAHWLISTTFYSRVVILKTFYLYRLHKHKLSGRRDKACSVPVWLKGQVRVQSNPYQTLTVNHLLRNLFCL